MAEDVFTVIEDKIRQLHLQLLFMKHIRVLQKTLNHIDKHRDTFLKLTEGELLRRALFIDEMIASMHDVHVVEMYDGEARVSRARWVDSSQCLTWKCLGGLTLLGGAFLVLVVLV